MNLSVKSAVKSVNARLAEELAVAEGQVDAAVRLLDEGATVPFIARYRKEVTGSLDDGQLRTLEERLRYLRELDQRRDAVLASIEEQGKLTDELKAALLAADTADEALFCTEVVAAKLALTEWLVQRGWRPFLNEAGEKKIAGSFKRFADIHLSRAAAELRAGLSAAKRRLCDGE